VPGQPLLLMQVLVNAGFGILFGAGLYVIGVPNPALWGVLAGILRIVPYVGTTIAATLPIALSLAVFDGWLRPLCVFLLVTGLELIIANFIEPWLYGAAWESLPWRCWFRPSFGPFCGDRRG